MPKAIKLEDNPDYRLTMKLLNEFRALWVEQLRISETDPVRFSQLSVVALTQLSAIVGVDVGMIPQQFEAVCRAQFDAAFAKAPRFG